MELYERQRERKERRLERAASEAMFGLGRFLLKLGVSPSTVLDVRDLVNMVLLAIWFYLVMLFGLA